LLNPDKVGPNVGPLLEGVAKQGTPDVAALFAASPGVPLRFINQLWNTRGRKSATPGVQKAFATNTLRCPTFFNSPAQKIDHKILI
jgi:hypothetical protein